MKNIAVFFGGRSVEHDISIITALQAMSALPKSYNLLPIYITPEGNMVTGENLTKPDIYLDFAKNVKGLKEVIVPSGRSEILILSKKKIKKSIHIDCALLCNHGHGGEDGSLQGLLEIAEIPYTSCGVSSSAICMDKDLTKLVLKNSNIPSPSYVQVQICQYQSDKEKIKAEIAEVVGIPCIVKPARLGSSVGIGICENEDMLEDAIEQAFKYDDKILIEEFLTGAREFCCAVIRNSDRLIASKVTEVIKGKIFTFEEKYLNEKKVVKRNISTELENKIKKLAISSYEALECGGVVRVDFLYDDRAKKLYVNEINSIPGSLAFNLFDTSFSDLITTLVDEAISRKDREKDIIYKFNSQAIEKFIEMTECYKSKG